MNHFCRQASRLTSDRFERNLHVGERIKLAIHLWMCASCRNYASTLQVLHATLKYMRSDEEKKIKLSPSRKQAIIAQCHQKNEGNASDTPVNDLLKSNPKPSEE
ncbi:MAG: hypothetical protein Q9M22_04045 [Mariprofundaceae bacterium]|nr:hypothetical protein [Mariprofundaceae bacterium]